MIMSLLAGSITIEWHLGCPSLLGSPEAAMIKDKEKRKK
jgi:hypothetical protein